MDGFKVQGPEFNVQSSMFRVQCSEFNVQGPEFHHIVASRLSGILLVGFGGKQVEVAWQPTFSKRSALCFVLLRVLRGSDFPPCEVQPTQQNVDEQQKRYECQEDGPERASDMLCWVRWAEE